MLNIKDKSQCCGCEACVQRCPKQCIVMREDEEGFLYPHVDTETCLECGLCEKVCPVINRGKAQEPLKVYAAKNRDIEKRELSSSGGLFIALAEQVINEGGVVFGVVFDERWEAHHVAATTIEEVEPMMRSKYIQSRTENTFKEAENYLKQGRKVMYTGTSCQIAGLKRFLRKEYDNLLAVDVICHGVPSPGVWRRYLKEELEQSARSAATGKNTVLNRSLKSMPEIAGISFREKRRSGFDWQKFGFVVWQKSASEGGQNSVLSSYRLDKNPFMRGFLADLYLRPSCHACPAKGGTSGADITIADYWGIKNVRPDFYDPSGVGLAVVHTEKGGVAFTSVNLDSVETSLDEATADNPSYRSSKGLSNKRGKFFTAFAKGTPIEKIVNDCCKISLTQRIVRKVKSVFKRVLKTVLPHTVIETVKK